MMSNSEKVLSIVHTYYRFDLIGRYVLSHYIKFTLPHYPEAVTGRLSSPSYCYYIRNIHEQYTIHIGQE